LKNLAEFKTTPLIKEHKKLGAKLAPFGKWLMPIQYAGIINEHHWTRSSCSLFDTCHMGEFIIYGESGRSNLEKIVTVNLDKISCGGCHYGFMLDEGGGIIDDVIIYKIKEDRWMLVVNAATTGSDEAHLKKHLSEDSNLENVSDKLGKLDLQGPFSQDILKKIVGEEIDCLKYYTFDFFSILGQKNIISRTGYTGELGYELYISNKDISTLWDLLLQDERVRPAGLGARDTLRLEMCYPLYGQEINREITPEEARLERFVDFTKDFIGKDALTKKHKGGMTKELSCFAAKSRRAPRHNYKIYADGEEIGIVTSGSFSPSLSCGVGMGYIEREYNKPGMDITIKNGNTEIEAAVTNKPFYKKGSTGLQKETAR